MTGQVEMKPSASSTPAVFSTHPWTWSRDPPQLLRCQIALHLTTSYSRVDLASISISPNPTRPTLRRNISPLVSIAKMRLHSPILLCSLLLFLLLSLVAADSLQKWTDIALKSKSGVIRLNDQTFDQLISEDRDYTVVGTSCTACITLMGSGSHGAGGTVSVWTV